MTVSPAEGSWERATKWADRSRKLVNHVWPWLGTGSGWSWPNSFWGKDLMQEQMEQAATYSLTSASMVGHPKYRQSWKSMCHALCTWVAGQSRIMSPMQYLRPDCYGHVKFISRSRFRAGVVGLGCPDQGTHHTGSWKQCFFFYCRLRCQLAFLCYFSKM